MIDDGREVRGERPEVKDVFILFFIFVLLLSSFVHPLFAWGNEDGGTEVMNSRGESMKLDFTLYDPGSEEIVDYSKFGVFSGIGTETYAYKITNRKGLAEAVGEGVYPDNSVYKDPVYRLLVTKGKLAGSQWDYVNIDDQQIAFYKWATSHDTPAVQQYYTALALEKLGATRQAIRAYDALIVNFPKQIGWTVFRTPLYMGRLAIDRIEYLTHRYPKLGIKLEGAKIVVENGYNASVSDDRFIVNPGKLVKAKPGDLKPKRIDVSRLRIVKTLGTEPVTIVQFENGHWQLRIDGKPSMVKAVAYSPTQVGKSPHEGYPLDAWQLSDLNGNGKADGPYDSWVDKNGNNRQDPDEKVTGDFQLMKAMGANTIRCYHHAMDRKLLGALYSKFGIRVIMGDLLGMYATGSGAEWFKGTDYTNPDQREKMKESVRQMVMEYKDEPYVLMWMLGNESNYGEPGDQKKDKVGFGSQAKLQLDAFYAFTNEVAGMIKTIDPNHLVALSNGETLNIDILSKHCDNIDIFGVNAYRGASGFGRSFWEDAKAFINKPVLLTEYGCPAYYAGKDSAFAEEKQMEYHQGNWEDIFDNSAGAGCGNAIGGVVFEFTDEWWKAGPPPKFSASVQETNGDFIANLPGGWMYEEWLGLTSQGDGSHSPFMRHLRKSYEYYKKVWNES